MGTLRRFIVTQQVVAIGATAGIEKQHRSAVYQVVGGGIGLSLRLRLRDLSPTQ